MAIKKKKKIIPRKQVTSNKTLFQFGETTFELTDQQALFCMKYVEFKLNGTKAALASGYSEKNAKISASALLTNPNVSGFIKELKKDLSLQIGINAADIAREYAQIGFSDIRKVFDDKGNLINVTDIEDNAAANISSVEIFEEFEGKGNERIFIGNTKKVKFYDKVAALDKLARMIGADGVTKVASTDPLGLPTTTKVEIVQPKPIDD